MADDRASAIEAIGLMGGVGRQCASSGQLLLQFVCPKATSQKTVKPMSGSGI